MYLAALTGLKARHVALALALALVLLLVRAAADSRFGSAPPYPPSDYLQEMILDWSTFGRGAPGSDNWATTWAADDNLYTTWGDGGGFGPNAVNRAYVSIGIARLTGSTVTTLRGQNMIGGLEPLVGRCFPRLGGRSDNRKFMRRTVPCLADGLHGKSWSILALGDRLHLFVAPGALMEELYDEGRLYSSKQGDLAEWTEAPWAFTAEDTPRLLSPMFAQAGRDNAAADHVYAYATRYASVGYVDRRMPGHVRTGGFGLRRGFLAGREIHLLRAARDADLMRRDAWEFFVEESAEGAPVWSRRQADSRPVFVDRRGVSWLSSAVFAEALGRWLLITEHGARSSAGRIGVFEAPHPWGPWRTVFYGTLASPGKGVPATAFYANFLPNSLGSDGRFTRVFTGNNVNDALNAVEGRFIITER